MTSMGDVVSAQVAVPRSGIPIPTIDCEACTLGMERHLSSHDALRRWLPVSAEDFKHHRHVAVRLLDPEREKALGNDGARREDADDVSLRDCQS